MNSHRLAKVTETLEEGNENEAENESPQRTRNNSAKNLNQLHVTINTKPEDMEREENTSNRRPSVLIQEILSTRRPSAIMAAIRSPKQFVNRYRREYVFYPESLTVLRPSEGISFCIFNFPFFCTVFARFQIGFI